MRIAHISDLHAGVSKARDEIIARQIRNIADAGVAHLIITGDLTQSGQEREYREIVRILEESDFYSSDKLTVVPGNHDLFGFFFKEFQSGRDFYKKLHKMPAVGRRVYRYGWDDYARDLGCFNSFFEFSVSNGTYALGTDEPGYPFIKPLNGRTALIGLDTNRVLPAIRKNAVCSNGYLEPVSTREILSNAMLENKVKIVLMHHHLWPEDEVATKEGNLFSNTVRLLNRTEALELFSHFQVDLVLHGHYHCNGEYWPDNKVRILSNGDYTKWSLIDINSAGITVATQSFSLTEFP